MRDRQVHQIARAAFLGKVARLPVVALCALALHAGAARADEAEPEPSVFSFSGFGTLGLVHSSEHRADFTGGKFRPIGAGYSADWSADVDSLIAAQVTATFTPKLSAVVQVVSELNYDHSYRPHVEWANLKYQFTPDFSVRVGRTALPVFAVTDSRKIGYANPWVRPPVEVYSLVPVTSNDGIDASYRMQVGAATNTLLFAAGSSDTRLPGGDGSSPVPTARVRKVLTLVDTHEWGSASLRLNYGQARLSLNYLEPLFDGFRQFGPPGVAIADRYDVHDRLISFLGVGAGYDPGDWFLTGEWGRISSRGSVLGGSTGWYGSGGYRFGKFTTYATYGKRSADGNTSDPGLDLSTLPPHLVPAAGQLNAALNFSLRSKTVQSTASVGGRWDFARSAALKLQLDYTRLGAGSSGVLTNLQPGFTPGGRNIVLSATLDFVF